MFRRLMELFAPFSAIAQELRIIRELYEQELLSSDKPVWRVTESPSKNDTEVSYTDAPEPRRKSALERVKEVFGDDEDTDDEI